MFHFLRLHHRKKSKDYGLGMSAFSWQNCDVNTMCNVCCRQNPEIRFLSICEQAVELRDKECLSFMSLCSQLCLITERMAAQHIIVYFITLSLPLFGDCNSANRIMNAWIWSLESTILHSWLNYNLCLYLWWHGMLYLAILAGSH